MLVWQNGYEPNFISDWASPNSQILLIGEAGGQREDEYLFDPKSRKLLSVLDERTGDVIRQPKNVKDTVHFPFVGKSGQKLNEWWKFAGLTRDEIHITNVVPYRPQDNDFTTIPEEVVSKWVRVLHSKIAMMKSLNVIVPTGNTALEALTGKTGISDWRGSILSYDASDGRVIKVIPTLHPAGYFRNRNIAYLCMLDWLRIAEDRHFPELNLPTNRHIIHPDKKRIIEFVKKVKANPDKCLCIDIENDPSTREVDCVGFGIDEDESITIPVEDIEYWPSGEDRDWVISIIKILCELPNPKILQGGYQHDAFYLFRRFGIRIVNFKWDTMAMSHCLTPAAPTKLKPHALDKIMSIHMRAQYHKKDTKDDEEVKTWKIKDKNIRWTYCGKDICWQYRAKNTLEQKLKEAGRLDLYHKVYGSLIPAIVDMSIQGVKIDQKVRRKLLATTMVECQQLRESVAKKVGKPLHAEKGFSVQKLTNFLYGKCNPETCAPDCKDHIGFKKVGQSPTNELTLLKLDHHYKELMDKYEAKGKLPKNVNEFTINRWKLGLDVIQDVLDHRESYQLGTFAFPENLDEDGRIRSKFKFGTTFCRLASTRNPFGTGRNLQNWPYASKGMIIPDDPEWILVELDLSQVENRIVFCLTGDSELIKLAKIKPWEFDIHTFNAAFLFNVPESEVTKDQRQTGKRIIHAGNYGEGPKRLAETLLTEAHLVWSERQCAEKIFTYHKKMPAIPKWQKRTHEEVIRKRFLVNSWGQRFDFWWDEVDKHLLNRALACRPQSDNGIMLNVQGVIPAYNLCQDKYYGKARLMLQVHDSILIGAHRSVAYDVASYCKDAMQVKHDFYGTVISVPATMKIGKNYHDLHEFKKFPEMQEFNQVMQEL